MQNDLVEFPYRLHNPPLQVLEMELREQLHKTLRTVVTALEGQELQRNQYGRYWFL